MERVSSNLGFSGIGGGVSGLEHSYIPRVQRPFSTTGALQTPQ